MQSSPEDPSEILRLLPAKWHEQFLAEYHGALDAAHESGVSSNCGTYCTCGWRAVAYSDPGFEAAPQATRDNQADEFVPAEQAIRGSSTWAG